MPQVDDDLQPRVRMPADMLRCILTGIEIVLVATIGLVGVQVSAAGATNRLPGPALGIFGFLAHFAVFVLPLALAAALATRRQWRRIAEAVLTAVVVMIFVALANFALRQAPFSLLYDGLAAAPRAGVRPALFEIGRASCKERV